MHTVVIRLSGKDFSTAIVRMRHWLEKHRCEPSAYRYTVVVSVNFAVDAQAKAFAKRFDGEIGGRRNTPVGKRLGDHAAPRFAGPSAPIGRNGQDGERQPSRASF